jgi:hypothetical protein
MLEGLPKRIKIGAYDWQVVVETEGDDTYGQSDFEKRSLRLWPHLLTSPAHAVGIVLHECLHVIYDNYAVKKVRKNKEEATVLAFEEGLVSLFRDNPKLLTWIKKCLK